MSIPIPKQAIPVDDDIAQNFSEETQPEKKLKGKLAMWLKLGLRLGCTIALLAFLAKSVSWSILLRNLPHLDDRALLVGIAIGFLGVIISAYQWQHLLIAEYININLRRLVNLYLVGIAFNHFLPTGMGGDMVKAYYVGKEGKNTIGATSAVVMSRFTGFIGMLLISMPAMFIWHHVFPHNLTITFLLACLATCGALTGAFCGVTLLPRLLKGKWTKNKMAVLILGLDNSICASFKQPRPLCIAIVLGMLFHISAALNYYGYAMILHIQVPFVFYLVAIPFVSLIAFLPISINGFGLRETAFVYIFTTMHIPPTMSFLLAFLMDIQTLLFGVVGGCIYLYMGIKRGGNRYGAKYNG